MYPFYVLESRPPMAPIKHMYCDMCGKDTFQDEIIYCRHRNRCYQLTSQCVDYGRTRNYLPYLYYDHILAHVVGTAMKGLVTGIQAAIFQFIGPQHWIHFWQAHPQASMICAFYWLRQYGIEPAFDSLTWVMGLTTWKISLGDLASEHFTKPWWFPHQCCMLLYIAGVVDLDAIIHAYSRSNEWHRQPELPTCKYELTYRLRTHVINLRNGLDQRVSYTVDRIRLNRKKRVVNISPYDPYILLQHHDWMQPHDVKKIDDLRDRVKYHYFHGSTVSKKDVCGFFVQAKWFLQSFQKVPEPLMKAILKCLYSNEELRVTFTCDRDTMYVYIPTQDVDTIIGVLCHGNHQYLVDQYKFPVPATSVCRITDVGIKSPL